MFASSRIASARSLSIDVVSTRTMPNRRTMFSALRTPSVTARGGFRVGRQDEGRSVAHKFGNVGPINLVGVADEVDDAAVRLESSMTSPSCFPVTSTVDWPKLP